MTPEPALFLENLLIISAEILLPRDCSLGGEDLELWPTRAAEHQNAF